MLVSLRFMVAGDVPSGFFLGLAQLSAALIDSE